MNKKQNTYVFAAVLAGAALVFNRLFSLGVIQVKSILESITLWSSITIMSLLLLIFGVYSYKKIKLARISQKINKDASILMKKDINKLKDLKYLKNLLSSIKDKPQLLHKVLTVDNLYGYTPLHLAIIENKADKLKIILDLPEILKTRILYPNKYKNTLLNFAITQGGTDKLKMLLDLVKNRTEIIKTILIAKNFDGDTLMHLAIIKNKPDKFKMLLDLIKDKPELLKTILLAKDKNGITVLEHARSSENTNINSEINEFLNNTKGLKKLALNLKCKKLDAAQKNPPTRAMLTPKDQILNVIIVSKKSKG